MFIGRSSNAVFLIDWSRRCELATRRIEEHEAHNVEDIHNAGHSHQTSTEYTQTINVFLPIGGNHKLEEKGKRFAFDRGK